MLKYAIIIIDDCSVSICSYDNRQNRRPIDENALLSSVKWAMKENLEIQFVYPNYTLDDSLLDIVESVSHINIMSIKCPYKEHADILIIDGVNDISNESYDDKYSYLIRINYEELSVAVNALKTVAYLPKRINFIIKNRPLLKECHFEEYEDSLLSLADLILNRAIEYNEFIQTNLITDRLFLNTMNNCNAGDETISIAPDGNFYICPAFYYENAPACGSVNSGLSIVNKQLYQLDHAPICLHCDAFHCTRCVWQNLRHTLEVNTPSKGQCCSSYLERRASVYLLNKLQENNIVIEGMASELSDISYLDPLENKRNWN